MADQLIPNPDPTIVLPPPNGPVNDFFPLQAAPTAPDTFEIGLVLGGTVSAAAYTAGVVDFLIQAFDAWTVGKNSSDPAVPDHKVRIKIAAGTSGGAITCVLLARVLEAAFPHCDVNTPAAERKLNPFYDCWVNQIDITDLLQTSDLDRGLPIHALLCADKIDKVCVAIENYAGQPLGTNGTPPVRDYVEQFLPLVLTLTNLRGVPYSADFRGNGRSEYYVDYADHIRFRADITGKNPPKSTDLKPFEIGISKVPSPATSRWNVAIRAARGSSAFPVGLPPQTISRDLQHYQYRYAVIESNNGPQAVWLKPAWPYMTPIGRTADKPYEFLAVDGGCFNNEPTEFARQWLAGVLGQNDRSGVSAHRAVLLVDPFADTPDCGLIADGGILKSGSETLSALKSGARYATADLDLFTADDVFSRFLINPVRRTDTNKTVTGGDAIATDNLAAFGGFLSASFREHDYLLGRRNCQQFLRRTFVLDKNNSLFNRWTAAQRNTFAVTDQTGTFLPIIPLMPALQTEIPQPTWPKNTFVPSSIQSQLQARIGKLSSMEMAAIPFFKHWPSWLLNLISSKAAASAASDTIGIISDALQKADL